MSFLNDLAEKIGLKLQALRDADATKKAKTMAGIPSLSLKIGKLEGVIKKSYQEIDEPYDKTFEYEPCIKDVLTGEKKNVSSYARSVLSTANVKIYAKPLEEYVKLFTAWDEEKYYSGKPGDYIAVREDDPHDIYVINGRLFDQLYKEVN